jgi:hypothetical protein
MTTPKLCCKVCGDIDDFNLLKNNICSDCLSMYKDVNPRWIKPSEKVWMIIEDDYRNGKTPRWICSFYGISRNSLYLHMKNEKEKFKKNIREDKIIERPFWTKFKEFFK